MPDVRWHEIEHGVYAAIYAVLHEKLTVFATHTCMEGCEFHAEPNMMTEWGFQGADYPLIRSLMRGDRGTPTERWLYWIAEPVKEAPDA